MSDVKLGTTQVKKMYFGTSLVWNLGAFSAATINTQGNGGFGQSNGTFTFNVISTDGGGTGGQITGAVVFRKLDSISSVVDGGLGHEIGDILTLEIVGGGWSSNPTIEVTAL